MRLRLLLLPLIFFSAIWTVSAPAQKTPHVRWIVDLKKNFGYESFERIKDVKKLW